MALKYLSGPTLNHLSRGTVTQTVGSTASLYPLTNLYNRRPDKPWRCNGVGSAVPTNTFKIDTLLLTNADFETYSSGFTGWTSSVTGTGAIADEGSLVHAGSHAAKFVPGNGTAYLYQDVTVRSGEIIYVYAWLRGDGTGAVDVRLQLLETGQYYASGAWSTTPGDWATRTTASYAQSQEAVTIPAYTATLRDTLTLRVRIGCDDAGQVAYVDDASVTLGVDWLSIHGHNLDPSSTIAVTSSWDDSSYTAITDLTPTVTQPAFYALDGAATHGRWWKVAVTTPSLAGYYAYIGELILGCSESGAVNVRHPGVSAWDQVMDQEQASVATAGGYEWRYARRDRPRRSRRLPIRVTTLADWKSIEQSILWRASGSPIVIAPDSTETDVLYGQAQVAAAWQRGGTATLLDGELLVSELPGPVSVL